MNRPHDERPNERGEMNGGREPAAHGMDLPPDEVGDDSPDLADCIQFIESVRRVSPQCLDGLVPDSSVHPNGGRIDSPPRRQVSNDDIDSSFVDSWLSWAQDVPASIGRFKILRKLGEGGFGVVLLALDPELDREVALKVPRAETLLTDEGRDRFLREGKAAARLDHRNIAPIYEAGQFGPICYVVSAFCGGGSLADLVDLNSRGPIRQGNSVDLPFLTIASLMSSLARAVQHAHDRGIIHRDLKPSNILFDESQSLTANGEGDLDRSRISRLAQQARIVDFGLAKSMHDNHEQTRTGATLGTPNYMSPEQARGEKANIGPSTDIYALGAILYELITGKPPFQRTSHVETFIAVKNDPPVPPRRLNPACPKDLEAVCLKCLEKDSGRRYSSASMLADEFERHVRGEPVLTRPPAAIYRLWLWCRRYPLATVLIGIMVTLAVVGPLTALNQNRLYQSAQEARQDARQTLYASDMNLALRDWDDANLDRCGELLRRHLPQPGQRDHRGFEWYYLWRKWQMSDRTPTILNDDTLEVIALSPDESTLAVGCYDGSVYLWDLRTGQTVQRWKAHPYRTFALAFSDHGNFLASASIDDEVKVWDVSTRRELAHLSGARVLAFSPVSGTLAYRTKRHSIAILEENQSQPRLIDSAHSNGVGCIAFSPNGQMLVSGGWDAVTRIWDVASLAHVADLPGQEKVVWSVSWSPDGKYIVSGDVYGTVDIWDAVTHAQLRSFQAHRTTVTSIAFSSDSSRIASTSEDCTVKLWEVPTGRQLADLRGHYGEVTSAAFAQEDRVLLTAGNGGAVKRWDVSEAVSNEVLKHPKAVTSLDFSDDGERIVTSCGDGCLRLWESSTGRLLSIIQAHVGIAWRVRFLKVNDQTALVSAGQDDHTRMWDIDTETVIREFDSRENSTDVVPLAISADCSRLAFADSDHSVQIWDLPNNKIVNRLVVGGASDLQFLADSRKLAVASMKEISVWDVLSAKKESETTVDSRMVRCLAIAPDGELMATGSDDRTVKLLDIPSKHGSRMASSIVRDILRGPAASVDAVTFSPDGSVLASAGGDHVIRLWHPQTGQQRATLTGHAHAISFLRFSPDGQTLASASDDQTLRLWHASIPAGR